MRLNIFIELFSIVTWFASGYFAFYRLHMPKSKTRRWCLLAAIALWAILLSLVFIPLRNYISAVNVYFSVFSLSIIALLCGDELQKSLFSVLYFLVVALYFDAITGYFYFAHTGYVEPQYTTVYYFFRGLCCVFDVGWAYFYYRIMRGFIGKVSLSFWLMAVLPAVGGLAVIFLYDYTVVPLLDRNLNIFFQGGLVFTLLLALNLTIFYMYVRLVTLFNMQMKTQTLQSQLEAQIRQNRLIEGAQKQAGEIRHQMKNLLFALQIELDHKNYEGIRTRLTGLVGELQQYEQKPYTAVPVIDAMISYKAEQVREYGAAFSVSAELLDISDALTHDIASILAIALDNAIDAVALIRETEAVQNATVHCGIRQRKNLLFIKVSNALTHPLTYRNGELQSTKNESGQGVGLPALRHIVERYDGEVKISDEDGIFLLQVMLRV